MLAAVSQFADFFTRTWREGESVSAFIADILTRHNRVKYLNKDIISDNAVKYWILAQLPANVVGLLQPYRVTEEGFTLQQLLTEISNIARWADTTTATTHTAMITTAAPTPAPWQRHREPTTVQAGRGNKGKQKKKQPRVPVDTLCHNCDTIGAHFTRDCMRARALCYLCQKTGHQARHCHVGPPPPAAPAHRGAPPPRAYVAEQPTAALMLTTPPNHEFDAAADPNDEIRILTVDNEPASIPVILDTAASVHITNEKSMLTNLTIIKKRSVFGVTGKECEGLAVGLLRIRVLSARRGYVFLTLHNVLYVPASTHNLISLGLLAEEHAELQLLRPEGPALVLADGTVLPAKKQHGLFVLQHRPQSGQSDSALLAAPSAPSLALGPKANAYNTNNTPNAKQQKAYKPPTNTPLAYHLHCVLGHVNRADLDRLTKDSPGFPPTAGEPGFSCSECLAFKSKHKSLRDSVSLEQQEEQVRPGQYVYTDMFGPIQPTGLSSLSYVVNYVDAATRHTRVYVIRSKGQLPETVAKFVAETNSAHTETVSVGEHTTFLSDNDTVYLSQSFITECAKHNARVRRTPPYLPQRLGKAEKYWDVMWPMALTMLATAALPSEFWPYAVKHAAWVKNRLPHSALDGHMSPYQCLVGRQPADLMRLHVFGATVWVHIEKPTKADARARPGVYVGQNEANGCPRAFMPVTGRVVDVYHGTVTNNFAEPLSLRTGSGPQTPRVLQANNPLPPHATPAPQLAPSDPPHAPPAPPAPLLARTAPPAPPQVPHAPQLVPSAPTHAPPAPSPAPPASQHVTPASPHAPPVSRHAPSASPDAPSHAPPAPQCDPSPQPVPPVSPLTHSSQTQPIVEDVYHIDCIVDHRHDASGDLELKLRWRGYGPEGDTWEPAIHLSPMTDEWVVTALDDYNRRSSANLHIDHLHLPESAMAISVREALDGPDAAEWLEGMREERDALEDMGAFAHIRRSQIPPDAQILYTHFVLVEKTNSEGRKRYKARMCVQGNRIPKSMSQTQLPSPVMAYTTLRTVLAFAMANGKELYAFDFKCAYLNADIDRTYYVKLPATAVEPGQSPYCILRKALYGLPVSGALWYREMSEWLQSQGWHRSTTDACLFTRPGGDGLPSLLSAWVDDWILALDGDEEAHRFHDLVSHFYQVKFLGRPNIMLGLQFTFTKNKLLVHQAHYIDALVAQHGMTHANTADTPFPSGWRATDAEDSAALAEDTLEQYKALVGSLLYIGSTLRPDIAAHAGQLAKHMATARQQHLVAAKYVLRYLSKTRGLGLTYTRSRTTHTPAYHPLPIGYSDASLTDCHMTGKSTIAYIFLWCNGAVSWGTTSEKNVSLSSSQSELHALAAATQEAIRMHHLMQDMGISNTDPLVIRVDNQATINLSKAPAFTGRSKAIFRRFHFIREHRESGLIKVDYIASAHQLADALTKTTLSKKKLEGLRSQILG